jgi:hypothetical protein
MVAKLTPILPKGYKHDIKELAKAIEETLDDADKQFAKTYRTWTRKPKFTKWMNANSDFIAGTITTPGEGSSENPYPFVERGTKVRYARMTNNFISKTQPGLISSRRGRGGVLRVDKTKPLPGIKARGWEEKIKKSQEPKLKKRINKALGRYVKKTGHAI